MFDRRLLLVLAAASTFCPGPGKQASAVEPTGAVEVGMAEGLPQAGILRSLDADRVVLQSSARGELTLERKNVLSIRFSAAPETEAVPAPWLLFPNGDRASLEAQRIDDESFVCRWRSFPTWKPFRVPLETVAGLIVNPPVSRNAMRSLLRALDRGPFDTDVLILRNRDRLAGELQSVSPEHYELITPVGPVQVGTPQVQAVAFNSSLISFPEIAGDTVLAKLTDGSWLTLANVRLDAAGMLTGETAFGESVAFPSDSIESLFLAGSRVRFVSTLAPTSSRTQPYLSPAVSSRPEADRNIHGGYLALRGREFPRGVGMTSASRITYSLNREYDSFRATVGVDDEAEGGGSVVFIVEADGRQLFNSGLVTGRDPPIDVGPLAIQGADELTLIVEYAEYGDILDVADWGNAVLVRPQDQG